MAKSMELSNQTRRNWVIDLFLFCGALLASLSGVYFLYLPVGYQGGRNPLYGINILFGRETWDLLHTWSGIAMISIAVLHIVLHWKWITSIAKRLWRELTCQCTPLNAYGKFNAGINLLIGLTFLLSAISGVYFLFFTGSAQAGHPILLFSRTTWDLIHTWASVLMILAAIIHFAIHWRWVIKVTKRIFQPAPKQGQGLTEGCQTALETRPNA
jgi:hypothetical protein